MPADVIYLGAGAIREIAARLGVRPTKVWGQNFVVDANTVKRIVRLGEVGERDVVIEVGPGLGSLTLGLADAAYAVYAVEIDPVLAAALPTTLAELAGERAARVHVLNQDALTLTELPRAPTRLVANLPYNVSVPVVLHLLERFPSIERVLVMVQLEVAERLAAPPGSRTYGAPSAKAAWYGSVRLASTVPRSIFWPVPNVDSGLVSITRHEPPATTATRAEVFSVVDAAFAQRRKMLRSALARLAGSPAAANDAITMAGIDPTLRGEQLTITDFASIAAAIPHG
ncbi:16S rRNA (adenine(1518)-N(6)/adenine(1519)-N(6))-dimethyltransferase RsmA [Nostocoides jenkinsii]|uniref:Ribosomal RNA small subunit methyltransferase A n=1 Tax=Nostocoides jenkinsii Ben 74 TaxID=1193518 RepID=A0A077MF45_9MICO|nr:16S rRNA (adenine(1518)-N(6)/adenine(1519)-N(6))-dimethyltransferase RsmA [Tetrasphaera jenkinsii]CCI53688.1 Ribosomal RNA small subunit methyltransferase A [Tetrasphaera jenkinsii Ben 74]